MQGNKLEQQHDASQGPRFPFSGWTTYGYWLNGELLNLRQYREMYSPLRGVVKTPKKPISAKQSQRASKYISRAASSAPSATLPNWLDIPTFDTWSGVTGL